MEKTRRPVDLPLLKIRLPVGGVISIVHRITGALLVLALPVATYWLDRSLAGEQGFAAAASFLTKPAIKLFTLLLLAIFFQHLVSGLRHLLLDFQIGLDRSSARFTAWLVPVVSLLLTAVSAWMLFR